MAGIAANNGSQLITADGVVGISGQAKYVYFIHIISGATAAVVSLRQGTAVSGTIFVTETGSISTGKTVNFEGGAFFPTGCFVDVDGNTTSVLVGYREA